MFKIMLQVKVDLEKFDRQISKIERDLGSIPSSRNLNNITRAVSSIAAKQYIKDINVSARARPKEFHHIYEWNHTGENDYKLFKIKKTISSKNSAELDIVFTNSKTKVPIAKVLSTPNKNGKSVRKSVVFKNKAQVMESGQSVQYVTRNIVTIPSGRKIIFRPKGTTITIKNPGGIRTTKSVEKFTGKWESSKLGPAIRKTGIFDELSKDIAKTMSMNNYNSSDIYTCIKIVCDKYDRLSRSF